MTDPGFYSSDRPRDASMPEDRPRGTTPGVQPGRSFKAFWLGALLLLLIVIVVIVAMVG